MFPCGFVRRHRAVRFGRRVNTLRIHSVPVNSFFEGISKSFSVRFPGIKTPPGMLPRGSVGRRRTVGPCEARLPLTDRLPGAERQCQLRIRFLAEERLAKTTTVDTHMQQHSVVVCYTLPTQTQNCTSERVLVPKIGPDNHGSGISNEAECVRTGVCRPAPHDLRLPQRQRHMYPR